MRDLLILQEAIYNTIEDIELWQEVLHLIANLTGARKGIITLRDRSTAELVIPTDVRSDFSSPLLYEFTEQEVESYVSHFIQFDPWTEFEKLFHPTTPYALSKYLSQKSLKASQFWQWLEPQGISDTVVLDIGSNSSSWIAMNLYFSADDRGVKQKILNLTVDIQKTMQDAWRFGQTARAAQLEPKGLSYFLEQQPYACLLLEADMSVVLANGKAKKLLQDANNLLIDDRNNLIIQDNKFRRDFLCAMEALNSVRTGIGKLPEIELFNKNLIFTFTMIEKMEDMIGTDKGLRLISILKSSEHHLLNVKPIWENTVLTKRERQLVELLATGGRVVDFIHKYKLAKSTGHFHWQNVKQKLNVKDRTEIYSQHQLFLQNL